MDVYLIDPVVAHPLWNTLHPKILSDFPSGDLSPDSDASDHISDIPEVSLIS